MTTMVTSKTSILVLAATTRVSHKLSFLFLKAHLGGNDGEYGGIGSYEIQKYNRC